MIGNNYFSLFSNYMSFSDAQIALLKWQPFNYDLKANILRLAQHLAAYISSTLTRLDPPSEALRLDRLEANSTNCRF